MRPPRTRSPWSRCRRAGLADVWLTRLAGARTAGPPDDASSIRGSVASRLGYAGGALRGGPTLDGRRPGVDAVSAVLGPSRLRQDHPAARGGRLPATRRRRGPLRRPRRVRAAVWVPARAPPGRHRAAGGGTVPAPRRAPATSPSACPGASAGTTGSSRCWTWSACRAGRAACRRSCPAASSSGSRWPGPWPRARRWCCSTSRSRRSMPALRGAAAGRGARGAAATGTTALLVTHDQEEALSFADRSRSSTTGPS